MTTSGTTTLRQLNGFDDEPASLSNATLLMVDFQNTYTTGVMELDGWAPALEAAAELLDKARAADTTVIHIINDGGAGTPYDIHAEIGQIHPRVAPLEHEAVVVKQVPNAFVDTELGTLVKEAGHQDVVIAGFMTHMCVEFTAQGAFLNGLRPTVVADACATRTLEANGQQVSAAEVHASALGAIADLFGVVVASTSALN